MGEITVTLNKRAYRLSCGDGEEARLKALAEHVRATVDKLVAEFGRAGDDRLLLMAALLITDELFETRESQGGAAAAGENGAKPEKSKTANRKSSAA